MTAGLCLGKASNTQWRGLFSSLLCVGMVHRSSHNVSCYSDVWDVADCDVDVVDAVHDIHAENVLSRTENTFL